jgi:hypothetical protein
MPTPRPQYQRKWLALKREVDGDIDLDALIHDRVKMLGEVPLPDWVVEVMGERRFVGQLDDQSMGEAVLWTRLGFARR